MRSFGLILAAVMISLLSIFLSAAVWIYDVFASGFVIHKLWAWFVVSTFHVAALPIFAAAGIALLVAFLTFQVKGPADRCGVKPVVSTKEGVTHAVLVIARPWLVLAFGFLITLFL